MNCAVSDAFPSIYLKQLPGHLPSQFIKPYTDSGFQCSVTMLAYAANWELEMEWKLFATVFASVFVAEMADKTQLVTLLFAADKAVSKWLVFLGSASALVLTSAIGVLAGALLAQYVSVKLMSTIAGSGFILIGAWTLYHGLYQAQ
jgi:putative Ca2+/H+ antiporter (TMEM165/GDT1 family)